MRAKRGRQAGFSLIEITAVVILIALVASVAMTRLDGVLPSTRSESAAREVLATLDFARTQAIAKAQPYEVVFDFPEQRYSIRVPFDSEGVLIPNQEERPLLSWHHFEKGVEILGILDPRGEIVRDGIYAITFDDQGASSDVHIYIGHTENKDFELTLRVLSLTGIASVFQGHLEPEFLVENDF